MSIFCRFAIPFLVLGQTFAHTVIENRPMMGSPFEITVVHENEAEARRILQAGFAEIDRLEQLISSWKPTSETSAVNRQAGLGPVGVSPELFNLVRRAKRVSNLTEGAFDITFAGVGKHWSLKSGTLPDPEKISAALALVDYQRIRLDAEKRTIFLEQPGMRIGFGAIGKGYAANRAIHVMKEMGAKAALVNAGGDLVATGKQEDGTPWQISIADPRKPQRVFAKLDITEQAVVTSGDYERFMMIDSKRYSHIINPKTGFPVDHLISVTVICPDGELADALATAVFVMGPTQGMALINRLKDIECIMVDSYRQILFSKNIQSKLNKEVNL